MNWIKGGRSRSPHKIEDAIGSVAALIQDAEAFRRRAREVARKLGPGSIKNLAPLLHTPAAPPQSFAPEIAGLSAWPSAWQFAIFEIIFNFKSAAFPFLEGIAFGEHDWTQGYAIEIICRLAACGIERERTITDFKRKFPQLGYETRLFSVEPLLALASKDPAIAEVVEQLKTVPVFRDTVQALAPSH
ncbi:MAG: hypothetical protein R3C68_02545 [Myxococcota bacterium]